MELRLNPERKFWESDYYEIKDSQRQSLKDHEQLKRVDGKEGKRKKIYEKLTSGEERKKIFLWLEPRESVWDFI